MQIQLKTLLAVCTIAALLVATLVSGTVLNLILLLIALLLVAVAFARRYHMHASLLGGSLTLVGILGVAIAALTHILIERSTGAVDYATPHGSREMVVTTSFILAIAAILLMPVGALAGTAIELIKIELFNRKHKKSLPKPDQE